MGRKVLAEMIILDELPFMMSQKPEESTHDTLFNGQKLNY